MQAAVQAKANPTTHSPNENSRGSPRFCVLSYIRGVSRLLRALPSYGNVIPTPRAKACSVPWNQIEIMLAWGIKRASEAIPKKILPTKIMGQLLMQPPIAMINWKAATPPERHMRLSLTPRRSQRQPIKKSVKMLGRAQRLQNSPNCVQLMPSTVSMESSMACGLLKVYQLAKFTRMSMKSRRKRIGDIRACGMASRLLPLSVVKDAGSFYIN